MLIIVLSPRTHKNFHCMTFDLSECDNKCLLGGGGEGEPGDKAIGCKSS